MSDDISVVLFIRVTGTKTLDMTQEEICSYYKYRNQSIVLRRLGKSKVSEVNNCYLNIAQSIPPTLTPYPLFM